MRAEGAAARERAASVRRARGADMTAAQGDRQDTPSSYLTPPPRAAQPVPRPRLARRTARRAVPAGLALTSATLMFGAAVFPALVPAVGQPSGAGDAGPAAATAQRLPGVDVPAARSVLDAVGSVRIEEEPQPEPEEPAGGGAAGRPSFGQIAVGQIAVGALPSSAVRLPFDSEWPLTDGFGYRSAPVEGFHDAQDIAAAGGTPVLAVATGVVVEAGWASDGCGFSAKLQHSVDGQELTSRYCHMEDASHDLRVGQTVEIGSQVGRVGNTGMSFGAHLHLALTLGGQPIDPLPFLRR